MYAHLVLYCSHIICTSPPHHLISLRIAPMSFNNSLLQVTISVLQTCLTVKRLNRLMFFLFSFYSLKIIILYLPSFAYYTLKHSQMPVHQSDSTEESMQESDVDSLDETKSDMPQDLVSVLQCHVNSK